MTRGKMVAIVLAMFFAVGGLTIAGCQAPGSRASSQTSPKSKPAPNFKITWYRPNEPVKTFEVDNYWLTGPLVTFVDPETGKVCSIEGTIRIDSL